MKTLRIDHVTVATPDASGATARFREIFELAAASPEPPRRAAPARQAALAIGDARIEFVTPEEGTPLAAALAANGEGMASLTLEVADLEQAAAQLRNAGVRYETTITEGRSRVAIDPASAHGVTLYLVEGS